MCCSENLVFDKILCLYSIKDHFLISAKSPKFSQKNLDTDVPSGNRKSLEDLRSKLWSLMIRNILCFQNMTSSFTSYCYILKKTNNILYSKEAEGGANLSFNFIEAMA
jgi:hypothetical protein